MKNVERMDTLLTELGYTFLPTVVVAEYKKTCGKCPSKGVQNWFAAAAPHLVLAYQLGTEGRRLEEYYSFLRPIEVYHERDTNLRA